MKRSYIREILDAINDETISFAGGLPSLETFPIKGLKEATLKTFDKKESLQYSSSKGVDGLRQIIASFYTKYLDFPTTKNEILITTGSQQAFDIISKSFLKKEIYVQTPTYVGALSAFNTLGLKTKSYSLDKKIKNKSAIYIMSDFTNPTTKSLSKKDRIRVKKDLEVSKSLLIEDGAYTFLNFDNSFKKPISAMYENSFHLGSFSKIIAPGLRVGWIRANEELLEKTIVSKEAIDLHTSTFNQMILEEYLKKNDLVSHVKKIRKNYKKKMNFMSNCFKKHIPSFSFEKPKGGMFIYGKFQIDSFELSKKAMKKNIAFVPASVFYHDNRKSYEARFNFTNSTFSQIEEGIKRLASLLDT